MTYFCYEVTKVIVVTVEADDENEAKTSICEMLDDGDYLDSFYKAEPKFTLLDVEEES